jgi:hypothetical protein
VESAIRVYDWNLRYAEALVADLTPELWTRSAGPGLENHAAWTIGHLVTGSDLVARDLGLHGELPEGYAEIFLRRGPGDPRRPDTDPDAYPPGEELLGELRRQHERVSAVWSRVPAARWAQTEDWAFGRDLPTLADATIFMVATHEAMHLGQLAAWRRALGLPSALHALAQERSKGG